MGIYNVHAGHCPEGKGASGASSILKESVENRIVKDEVIRLLKEKGHTVHDCTVDEKLTANECLKEIVKKCNRNKVDLDISIHLNSGRNDLLGDGSTGGTEVYNFSEKTKLISDTICKNISEDLHIRNRGTKYNKELYVLKKTNSPAILIECCFVDDKDDAELWCPRKCAQSIVDGILNIRNTEAEDSVRESQQIELSDNLLEKKKIEEDGIWGENTTKYTQEMLKKFFPGIIVDSIVSNQPFCNKKYLPGVSEKSWKFVKDYKNGSTMIFRLQWFIGADQDGLFGKKSIQRFQEFLKKEEIYFGEIDGVMGKNTVTGWQQYLNCQL